MKGVVVVKVRKVVPIAEARFRLLSNTPTRVGWTEVFWLATLDESRIGAVVFDPYDKDWGFVALHRQGTGCTKLFETAVSIESEKEAREACAVALAGGKDKRGEIRAMLAKHGELAADIALSKEAYYARHPQKPWPRS
jgi:hypothetical protein